MEKYTITVDVDTKAAEKNIEALKQKIKETEAMVGTLHGHKFKPLGTDSIYCECGEIRVAPARGYYYPYQPYWLPTHTIVSGSASCGVGPSFVGTSAKIT